MNGNEWIVEAYGCPEENLSNLALVRSVVNAIIGEMQLRPVAEPVWHRFPVTGGITGMALLAESHLACHTFPEFGSLCLNVFCCKPRPGWDFDRLKELLGATRVCVREITRAYQSDAASAAFAAGSRRG
jgi:S-adenosylmethionine decarboxylase